MKTKETINDLFADKDIEITSALFVEVEFILYVLYKALGECDLNQAHWYFSQYYKRFFATKSRLNGQLFFMLRKNFHRYYSKKQFNLNLDDYLSVSYKLRYFDVCQEDGKRILVKNKAVKYSTDRDGDYEKEIALHLSRNKQKIDFLSGEGTYISSVRQEPFEFDLGKQTVEPIMSLSDDREKKDVCLPLDFNWGAFKEKLGGSWTKRPTISLSSCDGFEKTLHYKGLVHIVGLLGAGKTTFLLQETKRLIDGGGVKIGIVLPTVADVLKAYEELTALGLNVAPLIGVSDLEKHQQNVLKARLDPDKNPFDFFFADDSNAYEILSGHCLLHYYANDKSSPLAHYPCERLTKKDEQTKYHCPLLKRCRYFKKFTDLTSADVWITTPKSLLTVSLNPLVDPLKRKLYELFHDHLDLVFVDEADNAQAVLDEHFITDESFYDVSPSGKNASIMTKFIKIDGLLQANKNRRGRAIARRWHFNHSSLVRVIGQIEFLIERSQGYHHLLIGDLLTPRSLFSSLLSDLEDHERPEHKRFIASLESFLPLSEKLQLNHELLKHELMVLYKNVTEYHNINGVNHQKETERAIIWHLKSYSLALKRSPWDFYHGQGSYDREKLFYYKFELFIYLVLIDYYFRVQSNAISNLRVNKPEISGIYTSFNYFDRQLLHFLMESIVGNIYGYQLSVEDNRLAIRIFNYSGIGRSLIEEWPTLKEEIGKKGPATVLLSATSYAPASAHFHLRQKPSFVLESENKEGKIEQFINAKYGKNDCLIRISGSNPAAKLDKLTHLTNHLIDDFHIELDYWAQKGHKRKVLVVVNSYDQCRHVGDVLQGSGLNYCVLSRSENLKNDEISSSQIEGIPSLKVDLVVAPLLLISRGYNILNEEGSSYFGSTFFLIRPYLTPYNYSYQYRILNALIPDLVKHFKKEYSAMADVLAAVQKRAFGYLDQFKEDIFWKKLSEDSRHILAWFTYIPTKQTVGRMQRKGGDCRVFYCDGSFLNADKNTGLLTAEESMLKAWENNLEKTIQTSKIGKILFLNYYQGLKQAIKDYDQFVNDLEIER